MTLRDLAGTSWTGRAELWLDPAGDRADLCDCTLEIGPDAVRYTWSHEGKLHTGELAPRAGGADFTDTFHSAEPMACAPVPRSRALIEVVGSYGPPGEEWGWRIALSRRPDGALVLQMTNVTPWGEEGRAVRMVCAAAETMKGGRAIAAPVRTWLNHGAIRDTEGDRESRTMV